MGEFLVTMGLLLFGAIGAAAAMLSLGYRRPLAHERRLYKMIEALEATVRSMRRLR